MYGASDQSRSTAHHGMQCSVQRRPPKKTRHRDHGLLQSWVAEGEDRLPIHTASCSPHCCEPSATMRYAPAWPPPEAACRQASAGALPLRRRQHRREQARPAPEKGCLPRACRAMRRRAAAGPALPRRAAGLEHAGLGAGRAARAGAAGCTRASAGSPGRWPNSRGEPCAVPPSVNHVRCSHWYRNQAGVRRKCSV